MTTWAVCCFPGVNSLSHFDCPQPISGTFPHYGQPCPSCVSARVVLNSVQRRDGLTLRSGLLLAGYALFSSLNAFAPDLELELFLRQRVSFFCGSALMLIVVYTEHLSPSRYLQL